MRRHFVISGRRRSKNGRVPCESSRGRVTRGGRMTPGKQFEQSILPDVHKGFETLDQITGTLQEVRATGSNRGNKSLFRWVTPGPHIGLRLLV